MVSKYNFSAALSHLVVTNKNWIIGGQGCTLRLERFIIEVALENPDIAFKVSSNRIHSF
jgi:hypothetical protein